MPSFVSPRPAASAMALAAALALSLSAAAEQPAPAGSAQPGAQTALAGMTASQLTGRAVWSDTGVQIGTVERVVEDQATGRLYALISTISMSGTASAHIVIDLADLKLREDGLMAPVSDRDAPLAERYAYTIERFRAVDPGRALGDPRSGIAAGEAGAFEEQGGKR